MRPSGVEGRDHAYRMTVESRYRRLPALKRNLRLLAYFSVIVWSVLTVLQTLPFWQSLKPFWPQGADDSLAWAAQAVTGGAIWTFGLFFFGAGGNFSRDDSPLLLKAYIGCEVLVALTAGTLIYLRRIQERVEKGTLALEGMEIMELVLYSAGIVSTLAAAYVAATYLQVKTKSKRT